MGRKPSKKKPTPNSKAFELLTTSKTQKISGFKVFGMELDSIQKAVVLERIAFL